jgi:hypothetical protein
MTIIYLFYIFCIISYRGNSFTINSIFTPLNNIKNLNTNNIKNSNIKNKFKNLDIFNFDEKTMDKYIQHELDVYESRFINYNNCNNNISNNSNNNISNNSNNKKANELYHFGSFPRMDFPNDKGQLTWYPIGFSQDFGHRRRPDGVDCGSKRECKRLDFDLAQPISRSQNDRN